MRHALFAMLLLALALPPGLPAAEEAAVAHQIVGKWRYMHADGCVEEWHFRPDGSLLARSGRHEAAASYSVSRRQNVQGFYELQVQPHVQGDGPRCAGSPLPAGAEPYVLFAIFHRTQPIQLLCATPGLEKCLGPLRRVYEERAPIQ